MAELLNIVDENDNIIGSDTRKNVHKKGLLHREIHVWIYKKNGDILFQKRAMTKDTYPGLLAASVGGHVEPEESYEETALKELMEKTGIRARENEIEFIVKMRLKSFDPLTNMTNNTFRSVYAFLFDANKHRLELEKGEAISLEFWPINKILNMPEKDKSKFVPLLLSKKYEEVFRKIEKLMK